MNLDEIVKCCSNRDHKVYANHMEALNRGITKARLDLRLKEKGLENKVFIPENATSFLIEKIR